MEGVEDGPWGGGSIGKGGGCYIPSQGDNSHVGGSCLLQCGVEGASGGIAAGGGVRRRGVAVLGIVPRVDYGGLGLDMFPKGRPVLLRHISHDVGDDSDELMGAVGGAV